jgi:hypothetical protein
MILVACGTPGLCFQGIRSFVLQDNHRDKPLPTHFGFGWVCPEPCEATHSLNLMPGRSQPQPSRQLGVGLVLALWCDYVTMSAYPPKPRIPCHAMPCKTAMPRMFSPKRDRGNRLDCVFGSGLTEEGTARKGLRAMEQDRTISGPEPGEGYSIETGRARGSGYGTNGVGM